MITREALVMLNNFCDSMLTATVTPTQNQTIWHLVEFYAATGIRTSPDLNYLKGVADWIDRLIADELEQRPTTKQNTSRP